MREGFLFCNGDTRDEQHKRRHEHPWLAEKKRRRRINCLLITDVGTASGLSGAWLSGLWSGKKCRHESPLFFPSGRRVKRRLQVGHSCTIYVVNRTTVLDIQPLLIHFEKPKWHSIVLLHVCALRRSTINEAFTIVLSHELNLGGHAWLGTLPPLREVHVGLTLLHQNENCCRFTTISFAISQNFFFARSVVMWFIKALLLYVVVV